MLELNKIYNMDCMAGMKLLEDNSVDFVLTDIPYNEVNRKSNGLKNLDKGLADTLSFDLDSFLSEVLRITRGGVCIFCGTKQFSTIIDFFGKVGDGTVRGIVWEKTNPSPMNGEFVYLSGVEFAVWFKKRRATFNGFCKNTVFRHPSIESTLHPTQKPVGLFEELICDNTNEGDLVFDPCIGSGTTAIACLRKDRNFIGFELDKTYFDSCVDRVETEKQLKEKERFFYNLVENDVSDRQ